MTDEVNEESLPSDTELTADAEGSLDATSSDSSPDAEDSGPKSALDAALAALGKGKEEEPAAEEKSSDSSDETDSETPAAEAPETDDRSEEDKDKELPFHKHPRWQEVYKERNDLRAKLAEFEPAVQKSQSWDNMQQFVAKSGLSDQDMDAGFEIMVAMKHDPAKAYGMLKPYMETLAQMQGDTLPEDLALFVENGKMDEGAAKQLARERSGRQWAESKRAEDATRFQAVEQTRTQQAHAGHVDAIKNAVTTWESEWRKSDLDFGKKHAMVHDRIVALVQAKGPPANPQAAVELAKEARADIEGKLVGMLPKREAKKAVTGGAASSTTTPRPKTALDAARIALGR